jgi:hypothetical protein
LRSKECVLSLFEPLLRNLATLLRNLNVRPTDLFRSITRSPLSAKPLTLEEARSSNLRTLVGTHSLLRNLTHAVG